MRKRPNKRRLSDNAACLLIATAILAGILISELLI